MTVCLELLACKPLDHIQKIFALTYHIHYGWEMDEQLLACVITVLALIPLVLYGISLLFCFITLIVRSSLYRKVDSAVLGNNEPGVSVLKPLMGVDPLLEENLRSHFELDYKKLELLFCVQDDQDPAINLYHRLCQIYPDVDTRLFIGGKDGIVNPMVNNMAPAYENAKYNYIWISSSRVKVSFDCFMEMLCKLQQPEVAVCHQMPYFTYRNSFANIVEKVHFGTTMAKYIISADFLREPCVTGMCYMFKKNFAEEVNGFLWYGRYLAEDHLFTTALHKRGYKLSLCRYPAQQNVFSTSIKEHKDRCVRWQRLRLNMLPWKSIAEPFMDCIPLGLYTGWSLWYLMGINPCIFFSLHICFWVICDYMILRFIDNGPLPFSLMKFLAAWCIRDVMLLIIFLQGISNPWTVKWGRKTYQVKLGGLTSVLDKKSVSHLI